MPTLFATWPTSPAGFTGHPSRVDRGICEARSTWSPKVLPLPIWPPRALATSSAKQEKWRQLLDWITGGDSVHVHTEQVFSGAGSEAPVLAVSFAFIASSFTRKQLLNCHKDAPEKTVEDDPVSFFWMCCRNEHSASFLTREQGDPGGGVGVDVLSASGTDFRALGAIWSFSRETEAKE